MFWPISIYLLLSLAIALTGWLDAGFTVGLSAIGTSVLSISAGGGLKASLLWGDKAQKIGGPLIAAIVMALALWISRGFSVQLSGYILSGTMWGWIGFVICFVFASKKLAS